MNAEGVLMFSQGIRANLQARITALGGAQAPIIKQFLDPFTDETLDPVNYPVIIINLAPELSPQAMIGAVELDAMVPIHVEYITRHADGVDARTSCSTVMRALIQEVLAIFERQVSLNGVQLVNVDNLTFDFIQFDGDHTGAAIIFNARLRDRFV